MKQLKKTLLTLVALLALTTGAWATEFTSLKVGDVLHVGDAINTGTNYTVYGAYLDAGFQPATLIRANIGTNDITESETGAYYLIKGQNDYYYGIIWGDEDYEGGYWPVTDTSDGISVTAITPDGSYRDLTFAVHEGTPTASSATPVDDFAWDKTAKTGTFTMPGGNVTLEPEYYPQATVADGGVTAADADARATTDDPLVKVDATKLTGAKKLMYFVSNSGTTAPAYDAEGWTDQLPTAEGFTQQGIVYVWYYPVGTDEGVDGATATYSDGDMNATALEVNIAAAPTYAVTFAEGVNPEPPAEPEWTADPNAGVTKGQTVTVTYTGSKKVIGVKAEKKAATPAAEGHALSASAVGEIVGSDGKAYAAADKDNLPKGVKAEALVCYVAGEHGLALAMADVKDEKMSWDNNRGANDGKTAAEWCTGWNTSHPITGATWLLASKTQWSNMISAAGSASNLSNAFSAVGGTNLQAFSYWSSTPNIGTSAWRYYFPSSSWSWTYLNQDNTGSFIRACLEW